MLRMAVLCDRDSRRRLVAVHRTLSASEGRLLAEQALHLREQQDQRWP